MTLGGERTKRNWRRVYLLGNFAYCWKSLFLRSEGNGRKDTGYVADRTDKTMLLQTTTTTKFAETAHCVWSASHKPGTGLSPTTLIVTV